MAEPTSCCAVPGGYCARVDTLFNLPGVHVLDVAWREAAKRTPAGLRLVVETAPGRDGLPRVRGDREPATAGGCAGCMTFRRSGRRWSWCGGSAGTDAWSRPVRSAGSPRTIELAVPRAKLTVRAAWWAISCIQRDTASVASVARRLGVDWHTVWDAIKPLLAELADDPARLAGVETLGVDEHIWHHQPRPGKGPKELTGMVDLTRRERSRPQARLLDLVPGRSGKVYADWLRSRGEAFTAGIGMATLDPFRGYGNAIRDELEDAIAVLDAFHVVKLGLQAMEETRRRVQQEQLGHRGRKHDPLYRIRNALRAGADKLTARQIDRIEAGLQAGDPDYEVTVAWRCYQQLRSAFHATEPARGPRHRGRRYSTRSTPARSPRSPDSAAPCARGASSSWPTSPPAEPTTAAPKPSTASSNSTAGSPAASATPPTTDSG